MEVTQPGWRLDIAWVTKVGEIPSVSDVRHWQLPKGWTVERVEELLRKEGFTKVDR